MKVTIEFKLPDDQQEYNLVHNADNLYSVLWELDQELRAKTKYAPDDITDDDYDAYQKIRETLHQLMRDNNVSLDMVK